MFVSQTQSRVSSIPPKRGHWIFLCARAILHQDIFILRPLFSHSFRDSQHFFCDLTCLLYYVWYAQHTSIQLQMSDMFTYIYEFMLCSWTFTCRFVRPFVRPSATLILFLRELSNILISSLDRSFTYGYIYVSKQ
jgi:hypothetical protein